jgi:TolB-like protein
LPPGPMNVRKLAAILVADVAGYSRLMEADEAGTLAALKERRKAILEPALREHGGRIAKVMGDGVLVEFTSAVQAVSCAVEVQKLMATANDGVPEDRRVILRIGINLGDVIVEGGDLYGDGVNVAARLQALAEPGEIWIAGNVHDQVEKKLQLAYDDLGLREMKNIARPVRVYRVGAGSIAAIAQPALALPDKPSIAVLPFQNMSGDPEQEYFADGMVEEIITALSRMRWLFVIARNSSFTYKGRAVDVKRVGHELGVRYVLEGSVRKAANRVRITGQLIDTATGAHLWADRFDGALEDVFDLQDQVTTSVVSAIAPKLEQAEIERARRKPTESLDAYDYFLRGMPGVHLWTKDANSEALAHFYRAIELDPNFASAYGMAARCYAQRRGSGWDSDRPREMAETLHLAARAAELGRDDAVALCAAGLGLTFVCNDPEGGAALTDRALLLNPNLALAWLFSGWARVWLGEHDVAIEHLARAMRLSPHDPHVFNMQAATACAHFFAGRNSEAALWAEMARRNQSRHLLATCMGAASNALLGRQAEAEKVIVHLSQLSPGLRLSNLGDRFPIKRSEDLAKLTDALRKAGLPE